jgi:hypothetical protein
VTTLSALAFRDATLLRPPKPATAQTQTLAVMPLDKVDFKMTEKKKLTKDKSPDLLKIGGVTALIVIGLWILNWIIVSCFLSYEQGGQFGDRFGATTSLFGGITIIGLLITIFLQRHEIQEGKKEFKQQNKTLKYQRFDNTFFNMISLHNQIVETLPNGRRAFKSFIEEHVNTMIFGPLRSKDDLEAEYRRSPVGKASMCVIVEDIFGQYINNLDMTIDIILTTKQDPKNQDKYLNIYFDQLTNFERIVLLYHFNLSDRKTKDNKEKWDKFKGKLFGPLKGSNQVNSPHATILDGVPK